MKKQLVLILATLMLHSPVFAEFDLPVGFETFPTFWKQAHLSVTLNIFAQEVDQDADRLMTLATTHGSQEEIEKLLTKITGHRTWLAGYKEVFFKEILPLHGIPYGFISPQETDYLALNLQDPLTMGTIGRCLAALNTCHIVLHKKIEEQIKQAAKEMDFEKAITLRGQLRELEKQIQQPKGQR